MRTIIFLFGFVLVMAIIIPTNEEPIAHADAEARAVAEAMAIKKDAKATTPSEKEV